MSGRQFLYLDLDDSGLRAWVGRAQSCRLGADGDWTRISWPDPDDLPASLGACLGELAGTLDLSGCRKAVVMVPDPWVSFRTLSLPFANRSRIRQILGHELAPVLPRDDIDYTTEFEVGGSGFKPGESLVFTASIPSKIIQAIRDALHPVKITPGVIFPRMLGCCLFTMGQEKGLSTWVAVEACRASLVTAVQGRPVAARSCYADAPGELASVIRTALAGICLIMGASDTGPIHVLSTGPEQDGASLKSDLESGGQTIILESFDGFPADPGTLPRGMMNLAGADSGAAALIRAHRRSLVTAGVLTAAVFLMFVTGIWMEIFNLESRAEAARMDARAVFLDTFPEKEGIMGPYPLTVMQSLVARDERKLPREAVEGLEGPGVARVLGELSARMPAGRSTVITRMNMGGRHLSLAGTTSDFNQVDRIKTGLSSSSMFKSVTIANAQADQSGGAIRFKLALAL